MHTSTYEYFSKAKYLRRNANNHLLNNKVWHTTWLTGSVLAWIPFWLFAVSATLKPFPSADLGFAVSSYTTRLSSVRLMLAVYTLEESTGTAAAEVPS